jgi:hypothetical protein
VVFGDHILTDSRLVSQQTSIGRAKIRNAPAPPEGKAQAAGARKAISRTRATQATRHDNNDVTSLRMEPSLRRSWNRHFFRARLCGVRARLRLVSRVGEPEAEVVARRNRVRRQSNDRQSGAFI